MNSEFKTYVDQLPGLLEDLTSCPSIARCDLNGIPAKGVYVFFDKGKPIYVGRSDDMKGRIQRHSRPSSGHGSATFAFLMAKKDAARKGIDLKRQRVHLENDVAFGDCYAEAKDNISKMPVKVVRIDDPILQTLFEVYAAVALGTATGYNNFENH